MRNVKLINSTWEDCCCIVDEVINVIWIGLYNVHNALCAPFRLHDTYAVGSWTWTKNQEKCHASLSESSNHLTQLRAL